MGTAGRISSGIASALRARWGVFAAVSSAVLVLDILIPVAVLSLARKPVDYFTFNPWLASLPKGNCAGSLFYSQLTTDQSPVLDLIEQAL